MRNFTSIYFILFCLSISSNSDFLKKQVDHSVKEDVDSVYKDWSFYPEKVFGVNPIIKVKYRTYFKISTISKDLVRVEKYNPTGILVSTINVNFSQGKIYLITGANQWGDVYDSMWLSPFRVNEWLVNEKTHGEKKELRCKFQKFIYENNLLKEVQFLSDSNKLCKNSEGVAIFRYKRYTDVPRFSLINETTCFDENGHPTISKKTNVFQTVTIYDNNANLISKANYGMSGEPVIDKSGIFKIVSHYDKYGNETSAEFYDILNKPVKNFLGWAKIANDCKDGFVLRSTMYDENNRVARSSVLPDPVAIIEYKYDAFGNQTEISYFDENHEAVTSNAGISKIMYKYSSNNMLTEVINMAKLLPGKDRAGVFCYSYVRDSSGRLIAKSQINNRYQRIRDNIEGGLIVKYLYDEQGRVVSISTWKDDSTKMVGWKGYHEVKTSYNENGQVESREYFDQSGDPSGGTMGYSKELISYNSYGLIIERKFFDNDSAIMLSGANDYATGCHMIKYIYNTDYQVQSLEYFDNLNKPADASIKLDNDLAFTAQRVDFEYLDGRLIKQRFYQAGNGYATLVVDCLKSVYLNPSGMGTRQKNKTVAAN